MMLVSLIGVFPERRSAETLNIPDEEEAHRSPARSAKPYESRIGRALTPTSAIDAIVEDDIKSVLAVFNRHKYETLGLRELRMELPEGKALMSIARILAACAELVRAECISQTGEQRWQLIAPAESRAVKAAKAIVAAELTENHEGELPMPPSPAKTTGLQGHAQTVHAFVLKYGEKGVLSGDIQKHLPMKTPAQLSQVLTKLYATGWVSRENANTFPRQFRYVAFVKKHRAPALKGAKRVESATKETRAQRPAPQRPATPAAPAGRVARERPASLDADLTLTANVSHAIETALAAKLSKATIQRAIKYAMERSGLT